MIKLWSCLFIIIGLAGTAFAIQCHVCSSIIHAGCDDSFGSAGDDYIVDCKAMQNPLSKFLQQSSHSDATGCLKIRAEINGNPVTTRQCYFGDFSKVEETCKGDNLLKARNSRPLLCELCTTDLCNGETSTGVFAASISIYSKIIVVIFLFSYFF